MSDGIHIGTNATLTVAEAAYADDTVVFGTTDADGDDRAHPHSPVGYNLLRYLKLRGSDTERSEHHLWKSC